MSYLDGSVRPRLSIRQLQLVPSAGRDFRILPPKTFLISRFLSKKKFSFLFFYLITVLGNFLNYVYVVFGGDLQIPPECTRVRSYTLVLIHLRLCTQLCTAVPGYSRYQVRRVDTKFNIVVSIQKT